MKKAAVVIGVDRTGHMPVLQAAASGADKFALWAGKQGFEVELLTDAGGKSVALGDIKKAVKKFVGPGTFEQFIVFFSGHGMLTGPDNEVWLLSDAPDDTGEAVDVAGSIWLARAAGIPHVLFVSDACRSVPSNLLFEQVKGGDIFPNNLGRKSRPEVDVFYAALPGHSALENKSPDDAANNYRAIFTECLLDGLAGTDHDVTEKIALPQGDRIVIPSYKLKPFLEREVPEAAERVHITLSQEPDIRVESHPPKFFGEVGLTKPGSATPAGPRAAPPRRRAKAAARGAAAAPSRRPRLSDVVDARMKSHFRAEKTRPSRAVGAVEKKSGFAGEMAAILSARGRDHFETTTGFTVVGSGVSRALVAGGQCDKPFDGPEGMHIRVRKTGPRARSVLIEFSEGTGTVLGIIPEFIGTVYVEDGGVVNVNYTPSSNTHRYQEYETIAEQIEERRAFVAVAARYGSFRLDPATADRDARYLRMMKAVDPTLGIYASYAYAQTGAVDQVESVLTHMGYDSEAIPFDVALLAGKLPKGAGDQYADRIAPFCPMFTQGWSILSTLGDAVHPLLREMRSYLVPSLWTTFQPNGLRKFWTTIKNGVTL